MPAEVPIPLALRALRQALVFALFKGLPLYVNTRLVLARLPLEHGNRGIVERNAKSIAVLGVLSLDRRDAPIRSTRSQVR